MKYFSIQELSYSMVAKQYNIDNIPPPECVENLTKLTELVLDPLRELWNGPLLVSSGYRSKDLNMIVGGVKGSQHCRGQAADLTVAVGGRRGNMKLFELLKKSKIPYDQVIAERTTPDGLGCRWVHVSWAEAPRKMYLIAR